MARLRRILPASATIIIKPYITSDGSRMGRDLEELTSLAMASCFILSRGMADKCKKSRSHPTSFREAHNLMGVR
jgi:hypothetical protein